MSGWRIERKGFYLSAVLELGGTEGAEPQDGRVYTVYIQHNGSPNRDLSARTTAIEATVIYISNCGKSP